MSPAECTVTHWPFFLDTITLPTKWRAECARQQCGPASDEGPAGLIEETSRDCGVNEAHSGTASPNRQGRKAESKLMAVLCVPATRKTTAFCRQVRQVLGVLSLVFRLH